MEQPTINVSEHGVYVVDGKVWHIGEKKISMWSKAKCNKVNDNNDHDNSNSNSNSNDNQTIDQQNTSTSIIDNSSN